LKIETLIRDRYNREARLAPALLIALPAALVLFAWFPALRTVGPALVALLGFCGGIIWLSHLARDRGKTLEPRLFAAWGGMPSTAMLRHRDAHLPAPLKARYKACLQKHLPDPAFPSSEEEKKDPDAADAIYASAGAWLLSQTRDRTRFGLLFEENVNYGFRRNFWALKPAALVVGVASLSASTAVIMIGYSQTGAAPTTEAVVATGLAAVYTLFVVVRVNSAWVRLAADAFGRQLLAACDVLPIKETKPKKTGPRPDLRSPSPVTRPRLAGSAERDRWGDERGRRQVRAHKWPGCRRDWSTCR